ncbi:MAG: hypothetical protein R2856_29740 [Caldilineaceae bacterium]
MRFRSGIDKDGKTGMLDTQGVTADAYKAWHAHGLTVQMVTGFRALSTYWPPAARFDCDVVYTNKPVPGVSYAAGPLRPGTAHGRIGPGGPRPHRVQAAELDQVKPGSAHGRSNGREGRRRLRPARMTSGLAECVEEGAVPSADRRFDPNWKVDPDRPHIRCGLAWLFACTAPAIAGLDMGAPASNPNDDGSLTCS